jgi:hypothetical protein
VWTSADQSITEVQVRPETSLRQGQPLGVITPKNLVVNPERAVAYCGYVLCGVYDRRIEHDIRCVSDIATHNPKESPRGRIYVTGNYIDPASGTTALCSQLLYCMLLEFSEEIK